MNGMVYLSPEYSTNDEFNRVKSENLFLKKEMRRLSVAEEPVKDSFLIFLVQGGGKSYGTLDKNYGTLGKKLRDWVSGLVLVITFTEKVPRKWFWCHLKAQLPSFLMTQKRFSGDLPWESYN